MMSDYPSELSTLIVVGRAVDSIGGGWIVRHSVRDTKIKALRRQGWKVIPSGSHCIVQPPEEK